VVSARSPSGASNKLAEIGIVMKITQNRIQSINYTYETNKTF